MITTPLYIGLVKIYTVMNTIGCDVTALKTENNIYHNDEKKKKKK